MELYKKFLSRGLYLIDANITTKTVELSNNLQTDLGLNQAVVTFNEYNSYFNNATGTSVYDAFSSSEIGTVWTSPLRTTNGIQWVKVELTNRYTDEVGYHHAISTIRKLTSKELNSMDNLSGLDIEFVLSVINDIQTTTSDKLFTKGSAHVLGSLSKKMQGFNFAVMQYIEDATFKVIDIADNQIQNIYDEQIKIGSVLHSNWIKKCYSTKKSLFFEDINNQNILNENETGFFLRNNCQSSLLVPIILPNGEAWGVIGVTNNKTTIWVEQDIYHITILANALASYIRRNQLQTNLTEKIELFNSACQAGKIFTWHWDCRKLIASQNIINDDGTEQHNTNITSAKLLEHANKEDMIIFNKYMEKIKSGETDSFKMEFRHRSFESFISEWYDIEGKVTLRDDNGQPLTMVGIARNKDKEKSRMLAEAAEIEHQKIIYNNLPVGIEFFDTSGTLTYTNDTMSRLYGVKLKRTEYSDYSIFNHMLLTDEHKSMIRNHDNHDIVLRYDFGLQPFLPMQRTIRNDIAYFTHKFSKLYVQGRFSGYMCVTIDTTESYMQKKQIKVFESYLSEIGIFAQLGVFWDNGSSIYTSEQWNINLGLPRNRKATFYDRDIDNVHQEDREKMEAQYRALLDGHTMSFQQDVRVLQFDGKMHWLRIFFARNESNEITGLSIEITQRKQNEKLLLKAKDKAEKMDMLKSEFIANMSHEIRTPLNAIVGFSDLIVQTDDPTERKIHAEIIKANNEHLLKLVNDILDFSQLESGNMEYKYEKTRINTLCEEIYHKHKDKIPSDIEFEMITSQTDAISFMDTKRTQQIISNLLNNAFKFTTKGKVTFWCEVTKNEITFHVKDTGIGIAQKDQERIFNSFIKLDSFTVGTGLGLSICNTMAQQMGGNINIISAKGKGSHFWLSLPLLSSDDFNSEIYNLPFNRQHNKATLIASNDQDTLNYLSYCLDEQETMHYTRTEGFFPMWLSKKPWLTVLDIRMFGRNITEYLPGIRRHGDKHNIIVLNYQQSGISNETIKMAGATNVIMMPITTEELKNTLGELKH